MTLPSTMKKLTFSIFALFLFAGTAAFAQESDEASAEASVDVVKGLTLNKSEDIQFGTVSQGAGRVTLDPTDGSTNNGGGTTSAGKFTAEGAAGETVQVSYDENVALTGNGANITFTADVHSDSGGNQGNSSEVTDESKVTLDSSGNHYFWVGGRINVPSDQATGTYTGTFNMDVEYTSL